MTPNMLMKEDDTEVAGALIEKAMSEGHSREEIEAAMHSFNRAEWKRTYLRKKYLRQKID